MRPSASSSGRILPRELLAQLDAPLVERVDVPDRALHEHLVLVERDDLAERRRIEPLIDHRRRGPVAGEQLVRQQLRDRGVAELLRLQLGARFVLGLAERQRLALREAVGDAASCDARRAGCATAPRPGSRTGSAACPGESADRTRAARWCPARPTRPGRCRSPPDGPRDRRACRCSPCRAAADTPAGAAGTGRRGAPNSSARRGSSSTRCRAGRA